MKHLFITMLFALSSCNETTPNPNSRGSDLGVDIEKDQSDDAKKDSTGTPDSGEEDSGIADTSEDVGSDPDSGADGSESEFIFEDNFNTDGDYKNNADWTLYNPDRSTTVAASAGALVIVPVFSAQNAWFEDNQSSLLHRSITGDFVVEASVKVSTSGGEAPTVGYNSAGFVLRDPSSTQGSENWLMYNLGAQTNAVPFGVEVKTTVNSSSNLQLFAVEEGTLTYELRVCRLGNAFRYFQRPEGTNAWTETVPTASHLRDDFPATIQVGLMSGSWSADEVQGTFDWVRAWKATACDEATP